MNYKKGFAIASIFIIVAIFIIYLYQNTNKKEELDTFDTPEEAFVETHKALQLVANNINFGMENVTYLEEYEKTKQIIFK